MSFGFSVGDFLAVIGLVTQLRKDFVDAPSQLRDLSAELKTFSVLLQDTEVDLTANDLDSRQHEALENTLSSAREFLGDLQKFIEKNKEIPKSTGSKARVNLKRIWKRLNFDQHEVSKFRHQISVIISGLQMFASNEVKHNTRKIVRYVNEQEHKDILKWLSDDDYNYHKNYQSHLVRNRQAGTRKWLLGSDEWRSWLEVGGQTLYCPGIPGSGKTFTTAMVIESMDNLSEEHGWVFAYVFCNYQQREENRCEMLLRSLLRMVLEQTHEISDDIQRWPTRKKEISIDEIIEQFRTSIKGCSRVFLMVDALDELDVFQEFVSYLFDIQKAVGVNLYFTSRKIPHIRMLFGKAMIVPIKATEHDVGVYLDNQMSKPHVPSFVLSNQALRDEIKQTVVNAVGEMFLLADLQVTQLMRSKSTRRLQNALKAISSGTSTYEATYEAAMDRIQSQDERLCELATNAISLLAYAERPLLAPELVHALSVDLDFNESSDTELYKSGDLQSMSDSLGVYDPDLMPKIEDVIAASAGLIVHQPDSEIVQLVHKTTKEYLMSENGRQKWFPQAQFTIAAICLIYSQAFDGTDDAADWPFLDYAQKHYGHHIMAQKSLEGGEGPPLVRPPLQPASASNLSLHQAQQLMDQIGLARMAQELGGTEDVLIVACETNQLNLARVLLSTNRYTGSPERPVEPDAGPLYAKADSAIDRALLAAAQHGHLELVELLLKYGASPMIEGQKTPHSHDISLLAIASSSGHDNIVSFFLEGGYFTLSMMQHDEDGFRPDAPFPRDFDMHFLACSPVCHAAKSGKSRCVKILLDWARNETSSSGQDTEQERILENVTLCAMAGYHVDMLEQLPRLSSTSISNMLRGLGDPHLLFTVMRWSYLSDSTWPPGADAVARLLLRDYTFDLSVRDASGKNALALAAEQGEYKVVRLILEEREDLLNAQDYSGRTPLSWAAERSMPSVEVLLGYNDIQSELVDYQGLAPIDYLVNNTDLMTRFRLGESQREISLWSNIIQSLKHGINRLDRHGCTLLHVLIDNLYVADDSYWEKQHEHSENLDRFYGRKIFECRTDWEHTWNRWRQPESSNPDESVPDDFSQYSARLTASGFRRVLGSLSISIAEVRSSTCKCGVGTIFLAISTENVAIVEVLLDLYPDLVNDQFFDGSSPLDLASCIRDQQRRQSMIDLILSKTLAVETHKTDAPRSDISESDLGDEEQDLSLADLELNQRRGDHTTNEIDDK